MRIILAVLCRKLQRFFGTGANRRCALKPITEDEFNQQLIGRGSKPDAHAKVELEVRREVEVERGKDLVLLLLPVFQSAKRPQGAVVLHANGNLAGQIETNL